MNATMNMMVIYILMIATIIIKVKKAVFSTKAEHTQEQSKSRVPNVPKKVQTTVPNIPKRGQGVVPNVPRKKQHHITFLEPHKEETLQPKIRTNHLWGEDKFADKRIVALRLMEGDPIPKGYIRIKCAYCGADNLVTQNCRQYHSCYFCRVPID